MLDSIYHMTKITLKSHFCRKNVVILTFCTQRCYGRHNVSRKSVNHWWFINFKSCMTLFHSWTRHHMIIYFLSWESDPYSAPNIGKQEPIYPFDKTNSKSLCVDF